MPFTDWGKGSTFKYIYNQILLTNLKKGCDYLCKTGKSTFSTKAVFLWNKLMKVNKGNCGRRNKHLWVYSGKNI